MNSLVKTGRTLSIVLAAGAAAPALADISFPNFNSIAGLTLKGVAVQSAGVGAEPNTVSLTPPAGNSAGAVWANTKQQVDLGFVTDFDFRVRDKMGSGADGLAFVLHNDTRGLDAIGGRGGALGFGTNVWFPNDPGAGLKNSLAIVFDTWDNTGDWSSIPGNNVITAQMAPNPLLANLPSSNYSIGNTLASGSINDGSIHHVRLVYSVIAGSGQLKVFYDNLITPALTVQVTLDTQLLLDDGKAIVGFSGATGGVQNSQRHEILNWTFTSSVIPAPGAATILGLVGLGAARRRRAGV